MLTFESLSEFALQKYTWTHCSGHPGCSLARVISCRWLSPSRLAFANTRPRFSCLWVAKAAGAPQRRGGPICPSCCEPSHRINMPSARAFTAATDSAPEAPWRRPVFAKGRKIPLRIVEVGLWPHSSGAGCAGLPLITREMVQERSCAEITHRDDQMWLTLFTCGGK